MDIAQIDQILAKARRRQSGEEVIRLNGLIDERKKHLERQRQRQVELNAVLEQAKARKQTFLQKIDELEKLRDFVEATEYTASFSQLQDLVAEAELEMEHHAALLEELLRAMADDSAELDALIAERAKFPPDVRANVVVTPTVSDEDAVLMALTQKVKPAVKGKRIVIVGGVPGRAACQSIYAFIQKHLEPKRLEWVDQTRQTDMSLGSNKNIDLLILFPHLMTKSGELRRMATTHGIRTAMVASVGKLSVMQALARSVGAA